MKSTEHLQKGEDGETHAEAYLLKKGFTLLYRNWKNYPHEIDLIALDGNTLVFAEVKTRSTEYFGKPEEAVSVAKQNKLQQAAEAYLAVHLHEGEIRFDVLSVVSKNSITTIHHIEDAFFPGDSW
ncbi:MAG: YraN family protein [Bacteroidia bacterium]|nr:YraN family protein [Bacteroidia bacterium]MBP7260932.1 YraN family protein [Bacteroidia bacterium]MBP9180328.1 YraN family protein [Bacteroidia bacterium]MBP9724741.1 YraN family protein [Bacteroidia bacterium]